MTIASPLVHLLSDPTGDVKCPDCLAALEPHVVAPEWLDCPGCGSVYVVGVSLCKSETRREAGGGER